MKRPPTARLPDCPTARLFGVTSLVLLTVTVFLISVARSEAQRVLPGLDVLRAVGIAGSPELAPDAFRTYQSLKGKRLGIVTNHTGRALDGTPVLSIFREELNLDVVALFSPEHGFGGTAAAGDVVETRTAERRLPVFSLYGETRKPSPEMLTEVDTLVFDMQDVGVRFYTYVSTMYLCLEAAIDHGLDFVVLDRPNPLGGTRIQGPVLSEGFDSFVGIAPLPLQHGMTLGEIANWFWQRLDPEDPGSELKVIRLRGWARSMRWPELGLDWIAPSPNIRSFETAIAYPGLALMEGTNVSEGRGFETPFLWIGAPWIRGRELSGLLNEKSIPGAKFYPVSFTPRSIPAAPRPKYEDELCEGVRIHLTSLDDFDPVFAGLVVLATIREQYADEFHFLPASEASGRPYIDLLTGSDTVRKGIEAGTPVDAMWQEFQAQAEAFRKEREAYLLY